VTEIEISQQDIDNLGGRLEEITNENERALLVAILAVAGKALRGGSAEDPPQVIHSTEPGAPVVVQLEDSVLSFQDQIAAAFTPGAVVELDGEDVDNVRVGHFAAIRVGHVASIKVGRGS
jgi:hypothetical protein